MSGGRWQYQSHRLEELAASLASNEIVQIIKAAARSEHIIDWAVSGDTARRREDGSGAERDLFDLWLKTFNEIYGD